MNKPLPPLCLHIFFSLWDVSLFSGGRGGGGGRATIFWRGHNFFRSCLREGHNFFQVFLGEGHNFFKVFFIEKINYEYHAAVGAAFRFLLILPFRSKKKCPEGRNKPIYMNLDVRYAS